MRRSVSLSLLALALVLAFWAGAHSRGTSEAVAGNQPAAVDLSLLWQAWRIIDERYVDTHYASSTATSTRPVSDEEKVWGMIGGLVNSLGDPYSEFLPPEENRLFEEDIRGAFGGIGVEIGARAGKLTVIAPLEDSPAQKAGLRAGDQIIAVDGQLTGQLSTGEAVNMIRGKIGTAVTLTIAREGLGTKDYEITREEIRVPTIETEILPQDIFLIRLFNFGATSPNLFRGALREFILSRSKHLIIDLRGNPGGYLDAAIDMASWFLPAGRVVAIEDHGDDSADKIYRSRGYNIFNSKFKLVILIDQGSASASEILAGALSEHGQATLVGEQTFGKGSVQELIQLEGDSALKITVARWLTPNGLSISSNGLTPDVLVEVPKDQNQDQVGDQESDESDLILEQGIKTVLSL